MFRIRHAQDLFVLEAVHPKIWGAKITPQGGIGPRESGDVAKARRARPRATFSEFAECAHDATTIAIIVRSISTTRTSFRSGLFSFRGKARLEFFERNSRSASAVCGVRTLYVIGVTVTPMT